MKTLMLIGPTASGKTSLAISLAKYLNKPIASADSRQVYAELNLGAGKEKESYGDVPVLLLDIASLNGPIFTLNAFIDAAKDAFTTYRNVGIEPMVCGGSGAYAEALIRPPVLGKIPVQPQSPRFNESMSMETWQPMWDKVSLYYPGTPDLSTAKRRIRALEIARWLMHNPLPNAEDPIITQPVVFCLNPSVEQRRDAIMQRLEMRLTLGMAEEVEQLLASGISSERLVRLGLEYKWITMYVCHELTFQHMKDKLFAEICRYAKRQMTWFRGMPKRGIAVEFIQPGAAAFEQILSSWKRR